MYLSTTYLIFLIKSSSAAMFYSYEEETNQISKKVEWNPLKLLCLKRMGKYLKALFHDPFPQSKRPFSG